MYRYFLSADSITSRCDGRDRIVSLMVQEESFVEGTKDAKVVITALRSDQEIGRKEAKVWYPQ